MAGRAWIGLVAVTACTFDAGGAGTASSDASSTGQPPATSVDTTGTNPTTGSETTALDSTMGTSAGTPGGTSGDTPGDTSSSGEPTCDASPPWWDAAWTRRRQVTVDASSVAEELTSVPIRVRLDDARIDFAAVEDGGADLRFVDERSTELAYEVEQWDESGDSEIWLRLPLVPAGGMPTVWMYYGNAAALPGDDPPAVWDADFVSVHHLADLSDATAQGHDGFGPSLPADAEGRIGRGRSFDGSDDEVELPQEADFDFEVALTVEVWARVSSFTVAWQALVAKGDDAWRLHRQQSTSFAGFGSDTPTTNDNLSGATPIDDGSWHHVAIVYGAGVKQLYVDGQLDAFERYPGPLRVTDAAVVLGNNQEAEPRFFHGALDELRISRVARSAAWIDLQARVTADASIVSVGDEETCP